MIWECVMVEWVVRIADMIPESLWWDISGRDMKCCHWPHISGTRTNVLCYVPFPFPLSEAWDESRQGLKKIMRHSSLYLLWKSTFKFEWLRTFPRNELSKCGAWSGVSSVACVMFEVSRVRPSLRHWLATGHLGGIPTPAPSYDCLMAQQITVYFSSLRNFFCKIDRLNILHFLASIQINMNVGGNKY